MVLPVLVLLAAAAAHAAVLHRGWPGWGGTSGQVSPQSVGSDMTIITHNDLYGNMSSRTGAAIVLSTPMTEPQAQHACAALGEMLWDPDETNGDFLKYLAYEEQNGPFWTAGRHGQSCRDITADGVKGLLPCKNLLPVLCTQTAPLSNLSYADNSTQWQTTVTTGLETITGFRDKFAFRFEGVRYAPEPELFTYSTLNNESGHSEALSFPPECMQGPPIVGSTDCLFLNIWTPFLPDSRTPATKLKPVMFWIYGGAFTSGYSGDPTFDGDGLASRGDVVVVTINYRLGTLGFLALDDGETNGNFGLADQIVALDWVHEHIKAFGGDPSRITIFGQSSGAASVRALLASPKARGKFAAAIPQSNLAGSNYATTYSEYYTIQQEVSVVGDAILNATGCMNASSQVDCLRKVSPEAITNLTVSPARFLVVDGTYLTHKSLIVNETGHAAHVPLMMGNMRDDGAAFISYPTPNYTVATFLEANGFNLSDITTLSVFPEPNGPNKTLDVFNTTALVATDSEFRCLDQATAYSGVKHDIFTEVYYYEFNRSYQLDYYSPNYPVCQPPIEPGYPYGDPKMEYFKCHSGDLYYTFGTIVFNGLPLRDDHDIPMSQFIVDTWSAFARSYDPNPKMAYLEARGFTNTSREIQRRGTWSPVKDGDYSLRLLEYPSSEFDFWVYGSQAQCDAVGFPLDYYETHD